MDIQQATQLAKAMVMHWGMSDKLGNVLYGEAQEYVFLGRDMMRTKDYSESTAQEIDAEVKRIINERLQRAKQSLTANRDKLEMIANACSNTKRSTARRSRKSSAPELHAAAETAGGNRADDGCAGRNAAAGKSAEARAAEIARTRNARPCRRKCRRIYSTGFFFSRIFQNPRRETASRP
jgi:hypothetical protein